MSTYENDYNSGIGSNGLTSARHDVLHKHYAASFPETFEPALSDEVVYIGKYRLTDPIDIVFKEQIFSTNIGRLILSPTRTFAPVLKRMLEENFNDIHGLVHSSGGGQTKCMKYMPAGIKVQKDNLFTAPEIFSIIQEASGADYKEMYQVFNMGCRMEIYTTEKAAAQLIAIAASFGIDAQVIGRVEKGNEQLVIQTRQTTISF
jgi:phosphoribosylformylglycinamidine cyclo-ligase